MSKWDLDFRSKGTKSILLVLSGPGGVGKSTLIRRWLDQDESLGYIKNITTRARRPPDPETGVNDDDFFDFVSVAQFKTHVLEGNLVQWSNASKGYYSGTLIEPVRKAIERNQDLIFDYTPQLFLNFKRSFSEHVVSVFVAPPSLEELRRRLQSRGTENGHRFEMKFKMGVQDASYVCEHDYYVVNENLDTTLETLKAIRLAEKMKLSHQMGIRERFQGLVPDSMLFYYDPTDSRIISMDNDMREQE